MQRTITLNWLITNMVTASCIKNTNDINSDEKVQDASSRFLNSFFKQCDAGNANLCEKPKYQASKMRRSFTRIMDYRRIEDSAEYLALYKACERLPGYVPVQVDDEIRSGNSRIIGIGLLHCLPAGCANDVDDLKAAFYRSEDADRQSRTERIAFHRFEQPSKDSDCNLRMADWSSWSSALQNAFNTYISRINDNCSGSSPGDWSGYCDTLYISLGEFDLETFKMYNFYDTDQFKAFSSACKDAGGHICGFDMEFTYQPTRGAGATERVDVNHLILGYPQCFSDACSYERQKEITEKFHLTYFLNQFKDRRLLSTPSVRGTLIPSLDFTPTKHIVRALSESEPNLKPRIKALYTEMDYNEEEVPTGSIIDYFKTHDDNDAILSIQRTYNAYTDSETCGENSANCYARLNNFCLR